MTLTSPEQSFEEFPYNNMTQPGDGVINHAQLMWAHPRDKIGYDYAPPPFWQEMGRILERGKFDAVFLAPMG
jgi:hypothetical protein